MEKLYETAQQRFLKSPEKKSETIEPCHKNNLTQTRNQQANQLTSKSQSLPISNDFQIKNISSESVRSSQNHETINSNPNTQAIHFCFSSEMPNTFLRISTESRNPLGESKCHVFPFTLQRSLLSTPLNIDGLFSSSSSNRPCRLGRSCWFGVLFVSTTFFQTIFTPLLLVRGQSEIYATTYFTFKSSCSCRARAAVG